MKTFYLNPSGDIEFDGQNDIKMVSDKDEIAQAVRIRLTTNLKEWFLDEEFGFDRFSVLGNKSADVEEMRTEITEAILQDERIDAVEDITFEFIDRKMNINFILTTIDDETINGGVTL